MLTTLIMIVHLIVCVFLIFIVLIQSGKGAELGAAFGGSSQTLFGARGAATFFSKLTTVAAVVFMLTSFLLAVVTSRHESVVQPSAPVAQEEQKQIPQGSGPLQEKGPATSPQGGEAPSPAPPK